MVDSQIIQTAFVYRIIAHFMLFLYRISYFTSKSCRVTIDVTPTPIQKTVETYRMLITTTNTIGEPQPS